MRGYRLHILSTIVGAACGYILLHPYAMLVYSLMHLPDDHVRWQEMDLKALIATEPLMLPMAVSFSVFGAIIGLLIGVFLDRRRMLHAAEIENERKKAALEMLRQVMVTLAHHLLNANMIIGGKVRHCRKATSDEDILASLEVIEDQGRKIDRVIKSLREVTEIKVTDYTTDGKVKMLDLSREIEEKIERKDESL